MPDDTTPVHGLTPNPNEDWIQWRSKRADPQALRKTPFGASAGGSKNPVAEPNAEYKEQFPAWQLVDDLLSGLDDAKRRGNYLRPHLFETQPQYEGRICNTILTPYYEKLTEGICGLVLRKQYTWDEAPSPDVEKHLENVDLDGRTFRNWMRDFAISGVQYGHVGVLVDYQQSPSPGGMRLDEERRLGMRPYWRTVKPDQILGFKTAIEVRLNPDGTPNVGRVLTQLRIRQSVTVTGDDEFTSEQQEQIQVFDLVMGASSRRVTFRTFVEDETDEGNKGWVFSPFQSGEISLPYIPFTVFYAKRLGYLVSKPPMIQLAKLNVRHYQLSSDLDHALNVAAYPQMVMSGVDLQNTGHVTVGVGEALVLENPEAKVFWLSPPTASFDPLSQRLDEIEGQLMTLAIAPLIGPKDYGESGISKQLDRVHGNSELGLISVALEDALNTALSYHADYIRQPAPKLTLSKDFDGILIDPSRIQVLSALQQNGQITLETLLNLLKQGEVLGDNFDVNAEIDALDKQFQQQSQTRLPDPLGSAANG